jgi:hypothetical protein
MQSANPLYDDSNRLYCLKQAVQLRCSSDPSASALTTPPAAVLLTINL